MDRFVRWGREKIWHFGNGPLTLCKVEIPVKPRRGKLEEAALGPRPTGHFCSHCDAEAKRMHERLMKVVGSPHFPDVEDA